MTLNSGFNDILLGTETSQLSTNEYELFIKLYTIDSDDNSIFLGEVVRTLDPISLALSRYDFTFDLSEFTNNFDALSKAFSSEYNIDFYITVESSITNCIVDTHLFTGHFAQQILDARFEATVPISDLQYNT
ncbi:hypothetical protein LCGC14_2256350, partial [marine sediment metagenome]